MTTADPVVVTLIFRTLAHAQQGKAGIVRVDANNPEGKQELTVCAIDSVAWDRFVVPALELAVVPIVKLGR